MVSARTVKELNNYVQGQWGRGALDFDDGGDQRIFWGLKFSILGFFGVGKFGKYFLGWLDLSRNLFSYLTHSPLNRP